MLRLPEGFTRPMDTHMDMIREFGLNNAKQHAFELFKEIYYNRQPNEYTRVMTKFKDVFKGKIYTFNYKHPINEDILDFYDKRPTVMIINSEFYKETNHHLITGINLNFIPYEIKKFMIEKVWEVFEQLIIMDIKRSEGKPSLILPQQIFNPNFDFYTLIKYVLNTLIKTQFEFAVRRYWWKKMSFIKCIDYSHWGLIPFIDTKDTVNLDLSQIHKLYWMNKHKKDSKIKNLVY